MHRQTPTLGTRRTLARSQVGLLEEDLRASQPPETNLGCISHKCGRLNMGDRVDYVLQERELEVTNKCAH